MHSRNLVLVGLACASTLIVAATLAKHPIIVGGSTGLVWLQAQTLIAPDATPTATMGSAISISNHTLAVGADSDDGAADSAGAVFVFEREATGPSSWFQRTKVTASDALDFDFAGDALDLDGDTLAMGAPGRDDFGTFTGAVYLFERHLGGTDNWGERIKLLPNVVGNSRMGDAVAIHSDTLAVGALGDDTKGQGAGAVYVFERNLGGANQWGLRTKIFATQPRASDFFGLAVDLRDDTLVVASRGTTDDQINPGVVTIFERHLGGPNAWGERIQVQASDAASGDSFGVAVSIDGDRLLVGADRNDDNGNSSGAAYIFERHLGGPNAWSQRAKLTADNAAEDDRFGKTVAIAGEVAVVGAPFADQPNPNAGSVYVFERHTSGPDNWGQSAQLGTFDSRIDDSLGSSVATDGTTVAAGADGVDTASGFRSGAAYTFEQRLVLFTADFESGDCAAWDSAFGNC